MRLFIIFYFFLFQVKALAQTVHLPNSIYVLSYLSGDFRQGEFLGAYTQIDSLVYAWDKKEKCYISDTIYNIHKIFEFKNGKFSVNLNPYSLLKRPLLSWIKKEEVSEILKEIDTLNYKTETFWDTIYLDSTKILGIRPLVGFVSRNYFFEYFNKINESFNYNFKENNHSEELVLSLSKNRLDSMSIKKIMKDILRENLLGIYHSSWEMHFAIILDFKTYQLVITQEYPGENNMTWRIQHSPKIRLINPKLNLLAFKLMPDYFAKRHYLLEFREGILKKFFEE
jgi:hypothetical protein